MAAHDMRNPLAVMLGYSQLMLEGVVGPLEGNQKKFVGSIHKAAQSLLQLVNEMVHQRRQGSHAIADGSARRGKVDHDGRARNTR